MALLSAKFKQDESDMKINRIFEKIMVVLAFMQILSPIITSFFCLIGIEMDMLNVMLLVMIAYMLVAVLNFSFNLSFMTWSKPTLFKILAWTLIAWIILSALVNGTINYTFIFYLCYVACFCMFVKVDKKYYKAMLYVFVIELTVCCTMGLIDPMNNFMPGFSKRYFPLSLQFANSNYASYVVALAILLCSFIIFYHKKVWVQVVFWICYFILNFTIFVNGCYSGEFAVFLALLLLIIYFWVKNKKCPIVLIICFAVSLGLSFASMLYPDIWNASSASANFFYETIAIFDNTFGTHLLQSISGAVAGEDHIITNVLGADGYDRGSYFDRCFVVCTESFKNFVFGSGAGKNYEVLVHNVYLQLWLEIGLVGVLLYVSLLAVICVAFIKDIFKTKKINAKYIFLFMIMLSFIIEVHNIGCLESYSFIYFVMLFAVLYKNSKKEKIEEAIEKEETAKVENSQEQTQNIQEEPQEEVVEVEKDKEPQRKKVQKKTSKPRLQENKQGEK